MTRFAEAVAENSQEEIFSEVLRVVENTLCENDEDDDLIDEIACLLLKLEIAAYRRGYAEQENKGRHPATGCITERKITRADMLNLRIIPGGRDDIL